MFNSENPKHSNTRGVTRRAVLALGGLGAAVTVTSCNATQTNNSSTERVRHQLKDLEQKTGATIGVFAKNLANSQAVSYRHQESFPMCSLFKVLAVSGLLLAYSPYGDFWERNISFRSEDIVEKSPITSDRKDRTMTVSELADAALRFSDNTAGNLLLRQLGGPPTITELAQQHGAFDTRLDRWEPELNESIPGDLRDTTTPFDIARLYETFLVGDALRQLGQARLRDWMLRNTTAEERLRAAIDGDAELADKTGAGEYGVVNDAGVIWRPDGSATVIAVLTRTDDATAENDNTILVEAARAALTALAG